MSQTLDNVCIILDKEGGVHFRVMKAAKIFIRLIAIEVSGHHVFGDSQVIWAHFPFFCGQEDNDGN